MKSILITGCSSGIGLACAIALQNRGYHVFASARRMEDVAMLKNKGLNAVLLDVTDADSIQHALTEILRETYGTLDAIFNNAGIVVPGAVADLTSEMLEQQFKTNVYGPIELIRQVLPIMRQQGHGRIIQNSSIMGFFSMPFSGAYSASKHALEALTSSLYQELKPFNIFISCINPGPVESKLRDHSRENYERNDFTKSFYASTYKRLETEYFKRSEGERSFLQQPDAVVKQLIKALESKRPRLHYYTSFASHMICILKNILPDSLMAKITTALMTKIDVTES